MLVIAICLGRGKAAWPCMSLFVECLQGRSLPPPGLFPPPSFFPSWSFSAPPLLVFHPATCVVMQGCVGLCVWCLQRVVFAPSCSDAGVCGCRLGCPSSSHCDEGSQEHSAHRSHCCLHHPPAQSRDLPGALLQLLCIHVSAAGLAAAPCLDGCTLCVGLLLA